MRVLYPGGFDLFHHGHHAALAEARKLAGPTGTLIVGVNSDALMSYYKRPPATTAELRAEVVKATGFADEVIIWDGPTGQAGQILNLNPDMYVAGTDWLSKDLAAQLDIDSLRWFEHHNISLLFLSRTLGISTTQLLEKSC